VVTATKVWKADMKPSDNESDSVILYRTEAAALEAGKRAYNAFWIATFRRQEAGEVLFFVNSCGKDIEKDVDYPEFGPGARMCFKTIHGTWVTYGQPLNRQ